MGWSLYALVPIVVLVSIIYTLLGGIKAVIWTDSIQMIVVISAVF
ncbi:sodium:solute symporter family transporter, partial [Clostridioides difficile]